MNAKEIDWSKAPKWATGRGVVGLCNSPVWLSQDQYTYVDGQQGGRIFYFDSDEGFRLDEIREVAEKPSPWNGTGLPPVGAVCEMCDDEGAWHRSTVIANGVDRGVPTAIGQADDTLLWCQADHHCRPVRTPDQIAAEEREKAADELCELIVEHYGAPKMSEHYLGLARALVASGYRKAATGQPSPAEISSDIKQANLNRLAEKVLAVSVARRLTTGGNAEVSLHGLIELVALAKELKQ